MMHWFGNLRLRALKFADATTGFCLCRILGYLHYALGRKPSAADLSSSSPKRILVLRPGGMGDMTLLLPAIRRLREKFPDADVDVVCEGRNIGVLELAGLGTNSIRYDSCSLTLPVRLFGRKYDIVLDTEQFHHFSAVIAFLSRAPARIGFKINPHRNPLYTHLVNYALDGPEGEQFMALLEPLGIGKTPYLLSGFLDDAGVAMPSCLMEEIKTLRGACSGLIAVHAGSSTACKQWGVANFVRLIQALTADGRHAVALVGGADDKRDAAYILKRVDTSRNIGSYVGRLSLAETAAVIKRASLFVGGDSGLAHLAIAVGAPTVVVFGPSDPGKWGLSDASHAVVRKDLPCSPCCVFGYHKLCRTVDCMTEVSVEDVLNACRRLMPT